MQQPNLGRRFARGMNKTVRGVGRKFTARKRLAMRKIRNNPYIRKPKKWESGYLSDNVFTRGPGQSYGYENAIVGGGLAKARPLGAGQQKRRVAAGGWRTVRGSRAGRRVGFSEPQFKDIIEFALNPGIDPNLIEALIQDASRIQQEGQTKIVIGQQLFQQIQAALQNYQIQKQQVDGMTAERIQSQGFEAGQSIFELDTPLEFGSRGVKRLKRRLLAKRNQVAQVQGAKSYKHAKELDAYGAMDDHIPVRGQSGLESAAEIQQKLRRKKMEGMQRRRRKQKTTGNVKYEQQSFKDAMEDVRKAKERRNAFTDEISRPKKRGRGYGMTATEKVAAGLGITGAGTGIYYYKRHKNKNQ